MGLANMTRVRSPEDVPDKQHFAIVIFETRSVYHEADERSRTNPGHGYPAYTETIPSNEYYVTQIEGWFQEAIQELYTRKPGRKDVLAFKADKLGIKTSVVVSVG